MNTIDSYYKEKREMIRQIWCIDSQPIKIQSLSLKDKYILGIFLNAHESNDFSYMKFAQSQNIFISKDDYSNSIKEFLKKGIFKINSKVHVTGFTDDGSSITDFSLIRFDLNVNPNDCDALACLQSCRDGKLSLSENEKLYLYRKASSTLMYEFYCDLCSSHHIKPESSQILEPSLFELLAKSSMAESLDIIHSAFEDMLNNDSNGISIFLNRLANPKEKTNSIRITYRFPYSVEADYLFNKVLGNGKSAFAPL